MFEDTDSGLFNSDTDTSSSGLFDNTEDDTSGLFDSNSNQYEFRSLTNFVNENYSKNNDDNT